MIDNIADNWYESFFTGINCEMWEKAVTPDWTEREVSFLMEVMNINKGASILDIPCGTGRIALQLAKKDIDLTCVDISEEYINSLDQKVRAGNLPVKVIQGNILTVDLNELFDGAYCLGNSFGYFDYDGMKVFVGKVASCLKPGGYFVINSGMVAESILPRIPPEKTYTIEDFTMQVNNQYFVPDSYMVSRLKYTRNNQTEEYGFKHYVYTIGEIKRLLKSFGLNVIALYNDVEKAPYQVGDAQVYLLAQKSI